jgi:hypothetical protein
MIVPVRAAQSTKRRFLFSSENCPKHSVERPLSGAAQRSLLEISKTEFKLCSKQAPLKRAF